VEWIEALQGKVVGLDTTPLIYFIEENPTYLGPPDQGPAIPGPAGHRRGGQSDQRAAYAVVQDAARRGVRESGELIPALFLVARVLLFLLLRRLYDGSILGT
jgi:hypothetical protein